MVGWFKINIWLLCSVVGAMLFRRPMHAMHNNALTQRRGRYVPMLRETLCGQKYSYLERIGRGAFSQVFRALNVETQQIVAIKVIKIKKGERKYVKDEIRTLETLQGHRNILTLHCALETTTAAYLVTEYYRNGSLETQKLKLHVQWRYDPKAAETTTRQYLKDLVSGLEKLDAHNIVHRDLKPSNLLIGDDGRLVIADFGVATELKRGERLDESVVGELLSIFGTTSDETSREYWVGTLFYKAPELLFRQPYTASVDLWSIGIILYQLVTAKYPFINLHSEFGVRVSTVQRHLATEMQKFFAIRSNVVETSTLPPDLEQLIAKLLLPQDQRITLSDVTAICNA